MQKVNKKKIIVVVAISLAALAFFGIVRSCSKGTQDKFEYSEVAMGKVERTLSVTGALDVTNTYNLLSKSAGIIEKVYVDFNQEVKKGQLLAAIEASSVDQQLAKLGAQLESMKLEIVIAKEDLESKRSMYKENLISQKGMERAEMNYKSSQLRYKQTLLDYEFTRTQKGYTRITAPIDGIIIQKNVAPNQPVAINSLLFILVPSLKQMNLTISIDESDIGLIKKDQNVVFTVSAFPDKAFKGKINQVRINPIVKGGLVTYESLVICDNKDQLLKPGMTATATIEINKKENALRVPNQSLLVNPEGGQSDDERNTVWRKVDKISGKLPVEKVSVEIGLRGDNYTEIKKNLKKGDKVLIKFIRGSKSSGK
jgi:HlyD family secretion protein